MLRRGFELKTNTKTQSTPLPQEFPETPCSDTASLRWIKLLGPGTRPFWEQKHTGPTNTYRTRVQPPTMRTICHREPTLEAPFLFVTSASLFLTRPTRHLLRIYVKYSDRINFILYTCPWATRYTVTRLQEVFRPRPTFAGYGYTSLRVGLNEKRLHIFCKTRKIRNFSRTAWTVFVMSIRLFPIIVRSFGIE